MPKKHITLKSPCSTCSLNALCLPLGLETAELEQLDAVIRQSRKLRKGEYLFRTGEPFSSLFAIRSGFFKTNIGTQDGRDQVTGFFMAGELMGMDGIGTNRYTSDAVALDNSEVCELPYERLDELSRHLPSLSMHFFKLMSRKIVRDQNMMLILGNMRAEERVAAFLLNWAERLKTRGFAPNDFLLRMSREEIGSFLGLKLETVSRTLTQLKQDGLISVDNRHIRLLNPHALQILAQEMPQRACACVSAA